MHLISMNSTQVHLMSSSSLSSPLPLILSIFTAASLLWSHPALGQETLSWENIPFVAAQSFDQGAARALEIEARGLEAQRGLLPGRVMDVHASGVVQAPLTASARSATQHQFQAGASIVLGALPSYMEALLDSQIEGERARLRARELAYLQELALAYAAWWFATTRYEHIREDVERAYQDSAPLATAAREGTLAELDWLDLEVTLARMGQEQLDASKEQADALRALEALLDHEMWSPSLTPLPPNLSKTNPWEALLDQITRHPDVILLSRQAETLRAQAEVEQRLYPTILALDVGWTSIIPSAHWSYLQASITVPLSNPARAEAARKRIQANAIDQERLLLLERLQRDLVARAHHHDTLRENLSQLEEGGLVTIQKRQNLLEQNLEEEQVTLARVLQGRQDLHEAQHQKLAILLELELQELLAEQLRRWLDGEHP